MSFKYKRLDKNDAAVLLIDHQTGLFNLVRDFEPIQFKNNVLKLLLSDVRDRLMHGTMKSLLRQSKRLVKNN